MKRVIKWLVFAALGVLAWLVGEYVREYFQPYRKITINTKGK